MQHVAWRPWRASEPPLHAARPDATGLDPVVYDANALGIALCALGAVAILEQVQASNSEILHPNHTLYTSSVAYCEAPGPLLLQSLDLKYSDDTHTLDSVSYTHLTLPTNREV